MTFAPVMWSIWTVIVVIFAALYVYRSSLSRDEADQVYLDDSFEQEKLAQEVIVTKINRLEPWVRVASWLLAASTLMVIGYYLLDIYRKLS